MSIDPFRVRVQGPLGPFAAGFARELTRQGYTQISALGQMRQLARLSRWLALEGIDLKDLGASDLDRFVRTRRAACRQLRSIKALQPILSHLRALGVVQQPSPRAPDNPVDDLLQRYRRYLTVERGLGKATAIGYADCVRPFLRQRLSPDGLALELAGLATTDIVAFVVAHCPRLGRGTASLTVTALRSLLGFLHVEGLIGHSLAACVPSVAGRRLSGLPRGLDSDQIERLLASCDCGTSLGCRDFAVLTVLVRLGLRAGEVARLKLDDVDWRAGEILVRGKGSCIEQLPLPADVGEAVAAYLRHGRPRTAQGRTIFVRVKAPHGALSSSGVSQIVAAAGRRAGLGQICAHRLRHTAASAMLRAGASLPEVGQVLRHRRTLTTAIYAKVDREALRTIARPWPGEAA
ncbi:site-specific integrase [Allomesorhizobium alhagi]|uniref:Phage integrase family protein n=1 Tax=Mesorhizobium alhagi CCNWXJ12-2 TaxID=1107882 RepID=H0I3Z7_9HYPH|nr:site-specific integrase [Mesorhizobium alhagi]EHK52293.1 phage integrase family protein [Mesorhizobium alhagi CCNWXJ12-2]